MVNNLAKKLEEWWKYDDPEELFKAASQKIQEQNYLLLKCKKYIEDPSIMKEFDQDALIAEIDKTIKDD